LMISHVPVIVRRATTAEKNDQPQPPLTKEGGRIV